MKLHPGSVGFPKRRRPERRSSTVSHTDQYQWVVNVWQLDEKLSEANARHQGEQASKVFTLTDDERVALR